MQLQSCAKVLLDGILYRRPCVLCVSQGVFKVSVPCVVGTANDFIVESWAMTPSHANTAYVVRVGGSCLILGIKVKSASPQEHPPRLPGHPSDDEDSKLDVISTRNRNQQVTR